LEEIRERERGRERDMLDLSSEDGWQWSKFRIGKHARQDPNGVRRHGMARLPGGVARESSTADPGEALEEATTSASPPHPSAHVGDNIGGRRQPEREREGEDENREGERIGSPT